MALKPNDSGRLTLQELEDYRVNSGITERQYKIIKRRFYDSDEPNVQMICTELNISETSYRRDLRKALAIIYRYEYKRK